MFLAMSMLIQKVQFSPYNNSNTNLHAHGSYYLAENKIKNRLNQLQNQKLSNSNAKNILNKYLQQNM